MPYCPNCGHEVDITARFCENCGEMLPVVNIPPIPKPSPLIVKRNMALKIILILAIISLIVVLFNIFFMPKNIVTESLAELLPTIYDLPSEWIIGNATAVTIDATGFSEGIKLELSKTWLEVESAVINIYRFDSSDSAIVYFDGVVSDQKMKGGYEEITTNLGDKSFGTFQELPTAKITKIFVIRMNIYYEVRLVSSISNEISDDAIELANIIDRKIGT